MKNKAVYAFCLLYWGVSTLRAESVVFPDNCFMHNSEKGHVIDITRPPYNADPSGATDCIDAFVAAYDFIKSRREQYGQDDLRASSWIVYLPNGTYMISNTIIYSDTVEEWEMESHEPLSGIRFRGQSRDGTIIRLMDNAPGYTPGPDDTVLIPADPWSGDSVPSVKIDSLKPVVSFGKRLMSNNVASNFFENITIHTGSGNPKAVGLRFHGANSEAVRNVSIISGDGRGKIGLDMPMGACQGLYRDISIEGFDYGIRAMRALAKSLTFEHVSIAGQNIAGILLFHSSVSIRKLTSTNSVPAARCVDSMGMMVLIDSDIQGGDPALPAIDVEAGYLFARNVSVKGYGSAIQKEGATAHASGMIEEYISDRVYTLGNSATDRSLDLAVEETPAVAWEQDPSRWACVNDFGARGDGITDDTEAIRRAMAAGKPVVYFLPGLYLISDSIMIGAHVTRINFMFSQVKPSAELAASFNRGTFVVSGNSTDPLIIEDMFSWFDGEGAHIWFEHASTRPLVLSDLHLQRGRTYRNTVPNGTVFIENCSNRVHKEGVDTWSAFSFSGQRAWIRYFNPECGLPQVTIDGGEVWVFGFKTEGMRKPGSHSFVVTNNGRLEILGGMCNGWGKSADVNEPLIVNDESTVSAVFTTDGNSGTPFGAIIREKRNGTVREMDHSDFPSRNSWYCHVPLYIGYTNIGVRHPFVGYSPRLRILENYPNPFRRATTIRYAVPMRSMVSVRIFTTLGRKVAELVNEMHPAGVHHIEWRPAGLSAGTYWCRFEVASPGGNGRRSVSTVRRLDLVR